MLWTDLIEKWDKGLNEGQWNGQLTEMSGHYDERDSEAESLTSSIITILF